MEKRYYWMRLRESFFIAPKMKKLRKIPGGDTYTIIYLKLALLSVSSNAILVYEGLEPTLAEELALKLDEDEDAVSITINFLKSYKLMEEISEGMFLLPEVEECIGSETEAAIRKKQSRENIEMRKQIGICDNVTPVSQLVTLPSQGCPSVSQERHTEIEIDIDIEIDKEIEKKGANAPKEKPCPYQSSEPQLSKGSFELRVTELLIQSLAKLMPHSKSLPSTEKKRNDWAMHIYQLRIEGHSEDEIWATMQFAVTNTFWKGVIKSTSKFREKYDMLQLQQQREVETMKVAGTTNAFNNFSGRTYDMPWLENRLIEK